MQDCKLFGAEHPVQMLKMLLSESSQSDCLTGVTADLEQLFWSADSAPPESQNTAMAFDSSGGGGGGPHQNNAETIEMILTQARKRGLELPLADLGFDSEISKSKVYGKCQFALSEIKSLRIIANFVLHKIKITKCDFAQR